MNKKYTSKKQIQSYAFDRTKGNLSRLEWFGVKHHSQSDEDGILHEIFKRIGTTNKTFVEFGAEIGTENNTRNLLENGWNGLWIEGIPEYISALKHVGAPFSNAGNLTIIEAYVNPENINQLIMSSKISGEIDLLSIDIDSIDWWVFDAIDVVNPRVVVLEHNYAYGPHEKFIMPLNIEYRWDYKNPSDYHHGASISSMVELATKKNYQLVSCGLYSANGFYVRKDLLLSKDGNDLFPYGKTIDDLFNPVKYNEIVNYPMGKNLYPNLFEKLTLKFLKKINKF